MIMLAVTMAGAKMVGAQTLAPSIEVMVSSAPGAPSPDDIVNYFANSQRVTMSPPLASLAVQNPASASYLMPQRATGDALAHLNAGVADHQQRRKTHDGLRFDDEPVAAGRPEVPFAKGRADTAGIRKGLSLRSFGICTEGAAARTRLSLAKHRPTNALSLLGLTRMVTPDDHPKCATCGRVKMCHIVAPSAQPLSSSTRLGQ
jgi:hypothetical protein